MPVVPVTQEAKLGRSLGLTSWRTVRATKQDPVGKERSRKRKEREKERKGMEWKTLSYSRS